MFATAAWLTIEPEISLGGYLASEALETGSSVVFGDDEEWTVEAAAHAAIPAPDDRA